MFAYVIALLLTLSAASSQDIEKTCSPFKLPEYTKSMKKFYQQDQISKALQVINKKELCLQFLFDRSEAGSKELEALEELLGQLSILKEYFQDYGDQLQDLKLNIKDLFGLMQRGESYYIRLCKQEETKDEEKENQRQGKGPRRR